MKRLFNLSYIKRLQVLFINLDSKSTLFEVINNFRLYDKACIVSVLSKIFRETTEVKRLFNLSSLLISSYSHQSLRHYSIACRYAAPCSVISLLQSSAALAQIDTGKPGRAPSIYT